MVVQYPPSIPAMAIVVTTLLAAAVPSQAILAGPPDMPSSVDYIGGGATYYADPFVVCQHSDYTPHGLDGIGIGGACYMETGERGSFKVVVYDAGFTWQDFRHRCYGWVEDEDGNGGFVALGGWSHSHTSPVTIYLWDEPCPYVHVALWEQATTGTIEITQ